MISYEPFYETLKKELYVDETNSDTFFYHKSTNQFWTILSKLYNCNDICHLQKNEISKDNEEQLINNRKAFLKKHQIGLWDVIDKCNIEKSKRKKTE